MNQSPHILMAKRQEQERDRLAGDLASLLVQHQSLQEELESTLREQSSIEAQIEHGFSAGMTGSQLTAIQCARQELTARHESLTQQCQELREQEQALRQQMLVCENKGKAHTRAQEKIDHEQERRAERIAQQRLDDLMAQRLGKESRS